MKSTVLPPKDPKVRRRGSTIVLSEFAWEAVRAMAGASGRGKSEIIDRAVRYFHEQWRQERSRTLRQNPLAEPLVTPSRIHAELVSRRKGEQ